MKGFLVVSYLCDGASVKLFPNKKDANEHVAKWAGVAVKDLYPYSKGFKSANNEYGNMRSTYARYKHCKCGALMLHVGGKKRISKYDTMCYDCLHYGEED